MGKSEKSRSGRGVLVIVAVLLFASGAVRVSTGTGQAVAEELENRFIDAKAEMPGTTKTLDQPVGELVEALLEREARVEEREAQLDTRLEALARVEARVQQQLEVLKTAEAALAETISQARGAAQGDVERLTALYENMKAKDAIPVFEQMDSTRISRGSDGDALNRSFHSRLCSRAQLSFNSRNL